MYGTLASRRKETNMRSSKYNIKDLQIPETAIHKTNVEQIRNTIREKMLGWRMWPWNKKKETFKEKTITK